MLAAILDISAICSGKNAPISWFGVIPEHSQPMHENIDCNNIAGDKIVQMAALYPFAKKVQCTQHKSIRTVDKWQTCSGVMFFICNR